MDALIYRPGQVTNRPSPLARYLPRLPQGAATAWLKDNIPPGSWVIDPFGASPQLAVEIAQAGYRLLVAANNPIARFLIEMAAAPPSRDEMQAALAELGASKRGDDRLEPHLLALYETFCDECGQKISAEAFLWEKDSKLPYARLYTCPHCKNSGEFPVVEADLQKATQFATAGPHRARALERVAKSDDPNRRHVEEALDAYIPRAVYGLFTIINKLDGLGLSEQQRQLLAALILSAADQANTLWPVPSARARPKQLVIPPRFRENNIWFALENAMEEWTREVPATPLIYWPEKSNAESGIWLYEGRLRELADQLDEIGFKAVVSAFPRPNQAFWTLSALWAGWLWGREAVGPFAGVLRRRRYDWAWHTTAIESTLNALIEKLAPETPFFGMITESEAGFDAAVMVAADQAGFGLQGATMRRRAGQSQFQWRAGKNQPKRKQTDPAEIIQDAGITYLAERGESSHYLHLQAAILSALIEQQSLTKESTPPAEAYSEVRSLLEFDLTYRSGFLRYQGSEHSLEVGRWWLREEKDVQTPLSDRVEKMLVNHLLANPGCSFEEIDTLLCQTFPGLMTPEEELLQVVLRSYAVQNESGDWEIKETDQPSARREDLTEISKHLIQIGKNLGFKVKGDDSLVTWKDPKEDGYHFHIIASAVLGDIVLDPKLTARYGLIVVPGGRAELVMYKVNRDHRMQQAIEEGWRFLKFRQVRRMAENKSLIRDGLEAQFELDPLADDDSQMKMF